MAGSAGLSDGESDSLTEPMPARCAGFFSQAHEVEQLLAMLDVTPTVAWTMVERSWSRDPLPRRLRAIRIAS